MPPPKTVLYLITKANWGGAQRYVWDLMTHAKEYGYSPILAYGEPGLLVEHAKDAGFPTYPVKGLARDINPFQELAAKRELVNLFKKLKPEVVHLNSSKAGFTGALAAKAAKVPRSIFTAHGWAFNEARPAWQRSLFRVLHRMTIARSDATICVSEAVRKHMDRGVLGKKLHIVHNGIDCGPLLSREDARQKLDVADKDGYWIGMVAELHPTKRVDLAIEAFSQVVDSHPDARLVVIGAGEERGVLETLIHTKQLDGRVHLLGFMKDSVQYLPAFDLFLFPSRTEAFGFVALEAGCAALPVIASNVGGIPEIIQDGESGILVPQGDADAFASAMRELMDTPERAKELSVNLKERVEREFPLKKMLDATFTLY